MLNRYLHLTLAYTIVFTDNDNNNSYITLHRVFWFGCSLCLRYCLAHQYCKNHIWLKRFDSIIGSWSSSSFFPPFKILFSEHIFDGQDFELKNISLFNFIYFFYFPHFHLDYTDESLAYNGTS